MVAIDNTYGAGILFDAFAAGVDISFQALTKYAGGHSDLLLGSIAMPRRKLMTSRLRAGAAAVRHGRVARRVLAWRCVA